MLNYFSENLNNINFDCIEYNETMNDNKLEEINNILYSLFEDDVLTCCSIKTLALS